MKRELIAAVALAVMAVDGKREVIQPGQPCPELSEHDTNELLRSGAVVDQSLERAQEQADKKAAANAMADFNAARMRVIAEQASASAAPAPAPEADAPAPPSKKKPKAAE